MSEGCARCVHAWAAGLFDGEGCITLYVQHQRSGNRSWRLTLRVMMKKKGPTKRLKALYGGVLLTSKKRDGREFALWVKQGIEPIESILQSWMPFLIEKRSQAKVAIEFCRFLSSRRGNEAYSRGEVERCLRWERRMKDLKHR